jgi:hypothetical protein
MKCPHKYLSLIPQNYRNILLEAVFLWIFNNDTKVKHFDVSTVFIDWLLTDFQHFICDRIKTNALSEQQERL